MLIKRIEALLSSSYTRDNKLPCKTITIIIKILRKELPNRLCFLQGTKHKQCDGPPNENGNRIIFYVDKLITNVFPTMGHKI